MLENSLGIKEKKKITGKKKSNVGIEKAMHKAAEHGETLYMFPWAQKSWELWKRSLENAYGFTYKRTSYYC